ncbi:hypothetical protein A3762_03405 [Oleiphilus sp. HI0125]|uniref:TraB/GumN family protein n=2 Tax=Oleiphilus sp. HI0125 TaxID=1822266 RepID=UPI0007C248E8|nr:TraB/GumN family protein [Oleiphilus sp. HI0125]KZZ60033.1 hypothetical protein A3762_03405 [Oleiphilus sp. HI0125]
MKATLLALIVLVFSCSVLARESYVGLSWDVKKDSDKYASAYLIGAVHMANSSFYPFDKKILDRFTKSDVLLVEADESRVSEADMNALMSKYALYPEGVHYRDELSAPLVERIEMMFRALGISEPDALFGSYRPGFLGLSLAALQAQSLGYEASYGIDRYFLDRAQYKKPVEELEGLAFQMELLEHLPINEAVFGQSLLAMADYQEQWQAIEAAWKNSDGVALYNMVIAEPMRDFPELKPYFEKLFFERNRTMADKIVACMQTRVCFVVVGAGHLDGPAGVVELLRERGLSLTQLQ